MMTNNQMTEGRYLRWHKARVRVAAIKRHLEANHEVYICTYTKATRYGRKHRDMFKATKTGSWVQHGKNWANIDYCKIEMFS